jgi:hypothetical protein
VTIKEVARVAGSVVVCGSGHRRTVASLARIRRAPPQQPAGERGAGGQRPDGLLGRVALLDVAVEV